MKIPAHLPPTYRDGVGLFSGMDEADARRRADEQCSRGVILGVDRPLHALDRPSQPNHLGSIWY